MRTRDLAVSHRKRLCDGKVRLGKYFKYTLTLTDLFRWTLFLVDKIHFTADLVHALLPGTCQPPSIKGNTLNVDK